MHTTKLLFLNPYCNQRQGWSYLGGSWGDCTIFGRRILAAEGKERTKWNLVKIYDTMRCRAECGLTWCVYSAVFLAKTTNSCKVSAHLSPIYHNLVNTSTHFYPLLLYSLEPALTRPRRLCFRVIAALQLSWTTLRKIVFINNIGPFPDICFNLFHKHRKWMQRQKLLFDSHFHSEKCWGP